MLVLDRSRVRHLRRARRLLVNPIDGSLTALLTPCAPSGEVDEDALAELIHFPDADELSRVLEALRELDGVPALS